MLRETEPTPGEPEPTPGEPTPGEPDPDGDDDELREGARGNAIRDARRPWQGKGGHAIL